jgi:MFS family permease
MTTGAISPAATQGIPMQKGFRLWSTVMVIICFILGIVVYGGGRYSFGVFLRPMSEAMAWSRTEVSLAMTINLLCYGFSSPIIGWLLDKIGARRVMLTGAILMSASLCAMYFVSNLYLFYFLYGVLSAMGANAVGRISQATIVANWFIKRRGLVMGITAISIGLGTAVMAPLVRYTLDNFGWQQAYVAIGLLMFALVVVPIALFVKGQGRPEDRGFSPDGIPLANVPQSTDAPGSAVTASDWSSGQALRSKAFWAITIATGLSYMADYVVLMHGPAFIEDEGYTGSTAAIFLSVATLSSCFGRVLFGWLADIISLKLGFSIMFGLQLIACPLILMDGSIYSLYLFAVIWGIGYSGAAIYQPYAMAAYFGRKSFSTIYGWTTMVAVFCGSIGGILGGYIHDTVNSYQPAWMLCALLWALGIVIVVCFAKNTPLGPPPQHSR